MILFYEDEERDNKMFEKFSTSMGWFTETNETSILNHIDYFCKDTKGRNVSVELKFRDLDIFKYENIFIEVEKFHHLMDKWENDKYIPIYINFFQTGDEVVIWDLRKYINNMPEKIKVKIYNKNYKNYQWVDRYLLPMRDGHYYKFIEDKNKYIKQW